MYEIFISYKHSDEEGNVTKDSKIAVKLYNLLTEKGYRVFCAEKSLKNAGSSRYQSDIEDAPDQAKIMVVVLTKAEYAMSRWVKYEWDGFFGDILSNVKPDGKVFSLTDGVSIHALPRSLRMVQNFSYADGMEDLLEFIAAAMPRQSQSAVSAPAAEPSGSDAPDFYMMDSEKITAEDIQAVLDLEAKVYEEDTGQQLQDCLQYYRANPDIYIFVKDRRTDEIVANVDVAPISDECYEKLRAGHFSDTDITPDMIMPYDMPEILQNVRDEKGVGK